MTEALGGNISFESAVGIGTKFTVTIPNRPYGPDFNIGQ
jgi:signal transduction histidine kinase